MGIAMTEKLIDITLRIKFKSPFIIGSGFGAAGIIDLCTVRDANGVINLPATSIKGKIRAEFRKIMHSIGKPVCDLPGQKICKDDIKTSCIICRIFGSEFHESAVIFEDAVMDDNYYKVFNKTERSSVLPGVQAAMRTGIKVDRRFKTAAEEALFVLEASNPCPIFTSRIHGTALLTDDEYEIFRQTIRSITHLGGNKSRGLGRCEISLEEVA
jgi:CRISPR/Cas system CSM-associated protein Csm3 (group 7 of RAMP superfamily)